MNSYQDSKSGGKMLRNNLTRRGLLQRALAGVGCSLVGLTKARTETPIATNHKVPLETSVIPSLEHCGRCLDKSQMKVICTNCPNRPPLGTRFYYRGRQIILSFHPIVNEDADPCGEYHNDSCQ